MSITSRIFSMEEHVTNAYNGLQGLGADLTNVDKNIENISMVLDDIYDSLPQVSDEGTSLTLDDTRVGKIKSTLKGNTSQDGTPTPSSPIPVNVVSGDNSIEVCGKNLNKTSITVNLTSGSEKWTGVSLSEVNWVNGTTYYIKAFLDKQSNEVVQITNYGYMRIDESSVKTITYNGNIPYIRVGANTLNANITNEEVKIMVSTETFTDFEVYSSGTYNIDLPTENKFDISKITESTYLSYDGTTGSSSVTNLSDYMQILPSKPCTISYTYTTLMNTSQRSYCWYTENKTYISGDTYTPADTPITITAPSNAKYIRFAYDKNCTNIQLQQSSKATPYGTTPIELCKIGNYQDYFYKDNGSWYLHKEIGKVVLDGTETWVYDSEFNYFRCPSYSFTDLPLEMTSDNRASYMQYANNFTLNKSWSGTGSFRDTTDVSMFYPAQNAGYKILLRNVNFTTTSDFSNWLSSNNTLIYYPLATPTNTEITYQPLIDQLNLLEKAMSKDGQTNISQVNNDLPFIISASALKEWSV